MTGWMTGWTTASMGAWGRGLGPLVIAAMLLLPMGESGAQTSPMDGAVSLPGGFALSLPFPAGTAVRASCAYGPDCSAFHVNTNVACCTNDYYALDLVRDQVGNGVGEPVTAMAAGTIIYADWATGGFSSFGRYVAIEHDDAGDGHTYFSIYAHLSAISVGVGEHVEMKQTLGNLGGSSNMLDGQFGDHVHVAVYQDATLGNGGMHGGLAVVPEPIDGYEDLMQGTVMVAGAAPMPPDSGGMDTGSSDTGVGDTGIDPPTGTGGTVSTTATTSGGATSGGATSNGSDVGSSTSANGADASTDPTTSPPTGSGGALPGATGPRGGDDGGCACRGGPTPKGGLFFAWFLMVLGVRRRDPSKDAAVRTSPVSLRRSRRP